MVVDKDKDMHTMDDEVEPFERTIFSSGRTIRNLGSRILHCCMILPLLFILALSITSLSYFAVTDENVGDVKKHCNGKCILFADYNEHEGCIDLSSSHACVFSIFGEVAVAVLASLLIVWMIIKAFAGFHMMTWILLCEVPVLVLHMVFAFCVSLTISIGIALTCSEYGKYPHAKGGCTNYTIPDPQTDRATAVLFYDNIHKSMVTSWLVVVLLSILLGAHIFFFIIFCVRRAHRSSTHELLPTSDGESSSDGGDSTEEAMVPIAELENR